MAYFTIWQGLRGCYMPDNAYTIRATTRRELKTALQWEAESIRDAGGIGMSKRAITWLAAAAWRNRRNTSGEYVAPYRWQYQTSYPYALGFSPAQPAPNTSQNRRPDPMHLTRAYVLWATLPYWARVAIKLTLAAIAALILKGT